MHLCFEFRLEKFINAEIGIRVLTIIQRVDERFIVHIGLNIREEINDE